MAQKQKDDRRKSREFGRGSGARDENREQKTPSRDFSAGRDPSTTPPPMGLSRDEWEATKTPPRNEVATQRRRLKNRKNRYTTNAKKNDVGTKPPRNLPPGTANMGGQELPDVEAPQLRRESSPDCLDAPEGLPLDSLLPRHVGLRLDPYHHNDPLDPNDRDADDAYSSGVGIIAVGIPARRPVSPDSLADGGDDEQEEGSASPSVQEQRIEDDLTQAAISDVIARNVAEEERASKSNKKDKLLDAAQGPKRGARGRRSFERRRLFSKRTDNKSSEAPATKRSEASSKRTGVKKSSRSLSGDFSDENQELHLAPEISSSDDDIDAEADAFEDRTHRITVNNESESAGEDDQMRDGGDDDDDYNELEAQQGIPVTPGAIAVDGIDSRPGEPTLSGYNSGFDSDESSHRPEGRRESRRMQDHDVDGPASTIETGRDGTAIQAELHEDEEQPLVEGETIQDVHSHEEQKRPIFGGRWLSAALVLAGCATVTGTVSAIVLDKKPQQGSEPSTDGWDSLGLVFGPTDDDDINFGKAVSLDDSGNRLAVGYPGADASLSERKVGGTNIYDWNGTAWLSTMEIPGPQSGAEAGTSVALSGDGSRLGVGSPSMLEKRGQIAVYEARRDLNSTRISWQAVGFDILGEEFETGRFGSSVALSVDGRTIAASAPYAAWLQGDNAGLVRVYEESDGQWTKKGDDIVAKAGEATFGWSVAMSQSGNRVAIGATESSGSKTGYVETYDFNGIDWVQFGQTIEGQHELAQFGISVDLSNDGSVLAVGADGYDTSSGQVIVFREENGEWTRKGSPLTGETKNTKFGNAVALDGPGNILAVGSPDFRPKEESGVSEALQGSGMVQVFGFTAASGRWEQVRGDILGGPASESWGSSISVSSDGQRVAAGAPISSFDSIRNSVGLVEVYEHDEKGQGELLD